ncbi:MAG: hypothetical protein H8E74_00145, partial [Gammaproteobacteria bacterium]|nr:hypothetical protein [Gammaproteobacteria bacterium]
VKLSIAADSNDVKIRRIDATNTDIKLLYNIYRKKKICNKVNKIFAALSITYFACLSVLLGYFKQMAFSQIISGAMFASGVASPLGIVSLGLVALLATWSVVSGYCLYRYQHAKASILKPKVEKLTLKNSFKLIPTPSSLFARVFKATQKNRPVEVGAAVAVSASSQAELGGCSRV